MGLSSSKPMLYDQEKRLSNLRSCAGVFDEHRLLDKHDSDLADLLSSIQNLVYKRVLAKTTNSTFIKEWEDCYRKDMEDKYQKYTDHFFCLEVDPQNINVFIREEEEIVERLVDHQKSKPLTQNIRNQLPHQYALLLQQRQNSNLIHDEHLIPPTKTSPTTNNPLSSATIAMQHK